MQFHSPFPISHTPLSFLSHQTLQINFRRRRRRRRTTPWMPKLHRNLIYSALLFLFLFQIWIVDQEIFSWNDLHVRFETSEMLAAFLASTPLLPESWSLCNVANTTAPRSFITKQVGDVGYLAFSGIQMAGSSEPSGRNLVSLESAGNGLFVPLYRHYEGEEEPVMVHEEMLHIYLTLHISSTFQNQVSYFLIHNLTKLLSSSRRLAIDLCLYIYIRKR